MMSPTCSNPQKANTYHKNPNNTTLDKQTTGKIPSSNHLNAISPSLIKINPPSIICPKEINNQKDRPYLEILLKLESLTCLKVTTASLRVLTTDKLRISRLEMNLAKFTGLARLVSLAWIWTGNFKFFQTL
jgi:hypothetical protein